MCVIVRGKCAVSVPRFICYSPPLCKLCHPRRVRKGNTAYGVCSLCVGRGRQADLSDFATPYSRAMCAARVFVREVVRDSSRRGYVSLVGGGSWRLRHVSPLLTSGKNPSKLKSAQNSSDSGRGGMAKMFGLYSTPKH